MRTFALPVAALSFELALPASTTHPRLAIITGSNPVERVPIHARALAGVQSSPSLSPEDVFALADHFEMRGIGTGTISAEVVYLKPWRNRPVKELPDEAVHSYELARLDGDASVTVFERADVIPAFVPASDLEKVES